MPIDITGEFRPSDGVHGFDLYDPQDIKAGNINVILQTIAGGAFKGGSHATAPAGEVVTQVKTTTGAPTHSATEGTICWNSVDDKLYVNNNGTTGWTEIGAGAGGGHTIQEEGTPLTARANLNFKGANVTVTDNAGTGATDVTIVGTPTAHALSHQAGESDPIDLASIDGLLAVTSGGTGATTAAGARTNLGVPSNAEAILDTLIDAKGDLIVGTAADTPGLLQVGAHANGEVLTLASGEATGLKWAAAAGGSGVGDTMFLSMAFGAI
jgi:hypothetical protein